MNYTKKIILVVCEGFSEKAYLQELNRYLDQNDYPFIFVAKPIKNGHFKPAKIKYTDVKKDNPKSIIYIWVDKDTYIRNDERDGEQYANKPKTIPDFLFNYNNFEDFIVMHLPSEKVTEWQEICRKKKHFEKPLHARDYIPLYKNYVINGYEKACMPFPITEASLRQAISNQKNISISFKSDFLKLLNDLYSTRPNT